MILFQAGNVPDRITVAPFRAEVLSAEKTAWTSAGVTGNVDIESYVFWVGPWCIDSAEMRFANTSLLGETRS